MLMISQTPDDDSIFLIVWVAKNKTNFVNLNFDNDDESILSWKVN